jgi:hypothetical protein
MLDESIERSARELRDQLNEGFLVRRGLITLADGRVMEAETAAKVALAQYERLTALGESGQPASEARQRALLDQLDQLHQATATKP